MPRVQMMSNLDAARITAAYEKARYELLKEREPGGQWAGRLAGSALSTATAVSALSLVERRHAAHSPAGQGGGLPDQSPLAELIVRGINWLADHQNSDGGWGDTDRSYSNVATTMLAVAAFQLTGVPADHKDLLDSARRYIQAHGGVAGLRRRYGKDKTFAVPILSNCALAGVVPWQEVSPLPFELACFPQKFYRFLRLPVVSYAIPALVAIGQARFLHKPPLNPLTRLARSLAISKSLAVLERMQPSSGGYLEAVPLTSFVVMNLAGTGRASHPVAQRGADFLVASMRPDGSWPIDTNLATWNTTLALNALAGAGEDIGELAPLDWLLGCQHREVHTFTGAEPGGWGWSDLSGAVPDADDTPGALLTLAALAECLGPSHRRAVEIQRAARAGGQWLLRLQNADGGWPTFCRGWGKLPFDRSGADLTAHAMRALGAWGEVLDPQSLETALRQGFAYLAAAQSTDGRWIPLWFGNQDQAGDENPVYGTAKVLLAYRDLKRLETAPAQRGFMWLKSAQNADGGWGGGASLEMRFGPGCPSSVEETAVAMEALLAKADDPAYEQSIARGVQWLVESVESGRYLESSPIGFYFAKLWYYEKLYPLIFAVSALGQALRRLPTWSGQKSAAAPLTC